MRGDWRRWTWVIGALALACDSGGGSLSGGESRLGSERVGEREPQVEPLPEPYAGPLDHARFEGATDLVNPFQPWGSGYAAMAAQLGPHTFEAEGVYYWAFGDDSGCNELYMRQMEGQNGPQVGTVSNHGLVTPTVHNLWEDCMLHTSTGLPEDPNAPGPPGLDVVVSVQEVLDGVANARSRWLGQRVRVHGVLTSVTRAQGANVTVTVSVGAGPDALLTTVGCGLTDIEADVDRVQGTPLEAVGTVTSTFGGRLEDCTVAFVDEGSGQSVGTGSGTGVR